MACKNPNRRPVHMWCPPPKESIAPPCLPCSTVREDHVSSSVPPDAKRAVDGVVVCAYRWSLDSGASHLSGGTEKRHERSAENIGEAIVASPSWTFQYGTHSGCSDFSTAT